MSVHRPVVFDPSHRNRAVVGDAPAASSGLVSKKDKMMEDLGLDEGVDTESETDSLDEDPRARPSAESALRQKIARLMQELDDLADKLTKVPALCMCLCCCGGGSRGEGRRGLRHSSTRQLPFLCVFRDARARARTLPCARRAGNIPTFCYCCIGALRGRVSA